MSQPPDSDPSVDGRTMEARNRLEALANDPVMQKMRDQAGYIPIWAMTGSAITFLLTDYAMKTGRLAPKAPRLAKFGMTVLGGFGGLQLGLWRLRSEYLSMDPNGDRLREMRAIMKELSKQQPSDRPPFCPKSQSNSKDEKPEGQQRNKYGDPIEDDSSAFK